MLNRVLESKSIVITWFISYALVLCIPLIFSFFLTAVTNHIVREEINSQNKTILKATCQETDNLLLDMERLTTEVHYNARLGAVKFLSSQEADERIFDFYNLSKELSRLKVANKSVDEIFIYLPNSGMFISTTTSSHYDVFYKENLEKKLPRNLFNVLLDTDNNGNYIYLYEEGDGIRTQKKTVFKRTYNDINRPNFYINVMIMIKEDDLTGQFTFAEENGSFFILDKTDAIIASAGTLQDSIPLGYADLRDADELITVSDYVVSYVESKVAQWKYVSVMPKSSFWHKMRYIRAVSTICYLLCILGGLAAICIMIKKQYIPLKRLLSSLGIQTVDEPNEYQLILGMIQKTLTENRYMNHQIYNQSMLFRAEIIAKLLKTGSVGTLKLEDVYETLDIHFVSENYVVALFYPEDIDGIFFEKESCNTAKNAEFAEFIINNVAYELLNEQFYTLTTSVDNMIVCLCNPGEHQLENVDVAICGIATKVHDFIKANFNVEVLAAVSGVHKGLAYIPDCFSEAVEAMEYYTIMSDSEVICYDEIIARPHNSFYYPVEKEQQLMNCVKCGDFKRGKEIIEEIFRINFDQNTLPLSMARILMYDLISTMIKTVSEANRGEEHILLEESTVLERLSGCDTVMKMKSEIVQLLESICRDIHDINQKTNTVLKDKIQQYINENYTDSSINVSAVANRFNMNSKYISKRFREQAGMGILEYVNTLRIQHAKQLFERTELTVEEVCQQTGYTNTKTFNRCFLKMIGITPGEYRKNYREQ